MSNKIEILTNIKCKSLFSETIPATSEFVAVCKSEQHGFGLLVYFPQTGIYSQVNAGVSQSLDQDEVKKALKEAKIDRTDEEEEPCCERLYVWMTPSMKAAIIERVMSHRKMGESAHGAMSNFIREAIILHLSRK
ncbi:MAG: hypothetical protein EOM59_16630 [Clostridia bacterium]|nr:hypothetical protein [Clostridia bacterium]